jgi:hypothetical protein
MTVSPTFPRPDDDAADYSDALSLDLGRFLAALEHTPELEHGFGLHDVHKVELAWEFLDMDYMAPGFVVDLVDGRRVVLEAQQDPESARDLVTIEPLAPGTAPGADEQTPWYPAHHITLHIAELKLLPPQLV